MKLTDGEIKKIEELFENPATKALKALYGGNIHTYIKEVERLKDMTEEQLRREYPTSYYWLDKWKKEEIAVKGI